MTQGKRKDIEVLMEAIKGGATDADIFNKEQYAGGVASTLFRMPRHAASYRAIVQPPTAQLQDVRVLWGAPGTGKTRYVFDNHPVESIFNASLASQGWFDGYAGEEVILFDDPNFNTLPLTSLLLWLDRYPVRLPVKGSTTPRRSKIIYITHNHPIEEWYPAASASHQQALRRRVTSFHHFGVMASSM